MKTNAVLLIATLAATGAYLALLRQIHLHLNGVGDPQSQPSDVRQLRDRIRHLEAQVASHSQSSSPPPPLPGGFEVRGACRLRDIRDRHETVDLGLFVKHGIHATHGLLAAQAGRCPAVEMRTLFSSAPAARQPAARTHVARERTAAGNVKVPHRAREAVGLGTRIAKRGRKRRRPAQASESRDTSRRTHTSVGAFLARAGGRDHAILAVRGQASFYRSAFNHVCNKAKPRFTHWRTIHDVDCRREGEFVKLLRMNMMELALHNSPFLMKEAIMLAPEVRRLMLVDYACIPKVITALCGELDSAATGVAGAIANSAEQQGYTDFWSMHNYTAFTPFHRFWDDLYDRLSGACCLELVKGD